MSREDWVRLRFWIIVLAAMTFVLGVTLTLAISSLINEPGGICI